MSEAIHDWANGLECQPLNFVAYQRLRNAALSLGGRLLAVAGQETAEQFEVSRQGDADAGQLWPIQRHVAISWSRGQRNETLCIEIEDVLRRGKYGRMIIGKIIEIDVGDEGVMSALHIWNVPSAPLAGKQERPAHQSDRLAELLEQNDGLLPCMELTPMCVGDADIYVRELCSMSERGAML